MTAVDRRISQISKVCHAVMYEDNGAAVLNRIGYVGCEAGKFVFERKRGRRRRTW